MIDLAPISFECPANVAHEQCCLCARGTTSRHFEVRQIVEKAKILVFRAYNRQSVWWSHVWSALSSRCERLLMFCQGPLLQQRKRQADTKDASSSSPFFGTFTISSLHAKAAGVLWASQTECALDTTGGVLRADQSYGEGKFLPSQSLAHLGWVCSGTTRTLYPCPSRAFHVTSTSPLFTAITTDCPHWSCGLCDVKSYYSHFS